MSITSARLLAHRCCIYMLLLSLASIRTIAKTTTTKAAPATDATTVVDPEETGSDPVLSLIKGKICQYNLTNSSHTLEAKSSIYQEQGFRQCQYFIQAPTSHFILLNFTRIHSKSDMPEEIGLGRHHPQQAASKTTTTGTTTTTTRTATGTTTTEGRRRPSARPSSPSPAPEPAVNRTLLSSKVPQDARDGKDNSTDLELERKVIAEGERLSSLSQDSISDSIASQPSSLHVTTTTNNNNNTSSHNSSSNIGQLGDLADSHSKEPSPDDTSPDVGRSELPDKPKEADLDKTSRSFNSTDSVSLPERDSSDWSSERPRPSLDLSKHSFVGTGAKSKRPEHHCSLKLIIEEVNSSSRSNPQVICWQKSSHPTIPLVYQYSVPVKITYQWDAVSPSGFSLDFSFLKPEEVDCLFKCDSNSHLCLPENLLCDGYNDCPDQSDEKRNACEVARQQHSDDEPHMTVVIAVAVSISLIIIFVLVLVLMISRLRCCNGGSSGRLSLLPPPNSQSSEVCRSASGSMQDSGQYEALLHHHQHQHQQQQQQQLLQQQTEAPSVMVASPRSSIEQRHLLHPQHQQHQHQQHQHLVDQQGNHPSNHQQQHHQLGWDPHHQLNPAASLSMTTETNAAAATTLSNDCHRSGRSSWQQQPHNKHHQPHRQARKHTTPSEQYPPQIPISGDGEEGYSVAQKALHSKRQQDRNYQMENEVFRPPPNKTVHDRDSPPPPYSPPEAKSLESLVHPVGFVSSLRPDRSSHSSQGSPSSVPRSHSLSYHQ